KQNPSQCDNNLKNRQIFLDNLLCSCFAIFLFSEFFMLNIFLINLNKKFAAIYVVMLSSRQQFWLFATVARKLPGFCATF
uniref:hypothetical protein n=1 Tax=Candidatus Electronema sp. TaxID=2698783 RepID=UPI004057455E